ncbi:isoprenylcysteine carboxylmethyltransferase family protein [Candidatus Bathyarchaeota archaeon]|nr:MAG: isoprenylcysteine carboxylmethyltransferase family protein [Candidatus Bathyarchaeota archaeon]
MVTMGIAKPALFETATLVGLIVLGLLGLRVDALFGLPVVSGWPYSYFGIAPILGGAGLRSWASSTIFNTGKGTPLYTRPPKALVMTGPYRIIRNPLYLGGFLIYLGLLIILPSLFLAILGLFGLPITYVGIIHEGRGLETRFGEDYLRYKQSVPGWIPRINSNNPS